MERVGRRRTLIRVEYSSGDEGVWVMMPKNNIGGKDR